MICNPERTIGLCLRSVVNLGIDFQKLKRAWRKDSFRNSARVLRIGMISNSAIGENYDGFGCNSNIQFGKDVG